MSVQLLNIDCMEYLRSCDHCQFSLTVADPPYGIDGNSHRKNKSRGRLAKSKDYHMALWDQPVPDDEYFNLIFDKSNNQVIFGGNYFNQLCEPYKTPRRENIDQWLQEHPKGWIAWDKCNGSTGFNDYELIWTSFKNMPSFVFKYMWNGFMQGLSIDNGHIQNPFKKNNEIRIHPTQKPVNLYKFLFKNFKGWTVNVLDTHLGSGSIALAADDMGINLTACELVPDYYTAACKRFKEQTAQTKLF